MKKVHVKTARVSREIVNFINENEIAKEDIVNLVYVTDQFILFYYY